MKQSERFILEMDKKLTKLVETGEITMDTKITALMSLTYVIAPKESPQK